MITLRLASPEDAPAIAEVHVRGWDVYRGIVPDAYLDALDPALYARRWAEWLAEPEDGPRGFTYVAEDPPGTVLGFANSGGERNLGRPELGEVRAIYVAAAARGRGAGRRLMAASARRLHLLGFGSLMIWVLAANTMARRFYAALGGLADQARTRSIGGAELEEIGYLWENLQGFANPLVLAAPDPEWATWFAREQGPVARALGTDLAAIEHVGSTAIPNLVAKPIVDMMAALADFPPGRNAVLALASLGYDFHGEHGLPGRWFFTRRTPDAPAAHLHVAAQGTAVVRRTLLFRDYLRRHPAVAAEYGALKEKLAAAVAGDVVLYTNSKSNFIDGVVARAAEALGVPVPPREPAEETETKG
jgi:GrpB-like predicted nucleotidyltransferase (UPF0157 family)/GNAT superfamily N-acetyltransferase